MGRSAISYIIIFTQEICVELYIYDPPKLPATANVEEIDSIHFLQYREIDSFYSAL